MPTLQLLLSWSQSLLAREVWQTTQPSKEQLDKWAEFIRQWLKQ